MNIRIPRWLVAASDAFGDFINKPVYRRVRRIDVLLVVMGIAIPIYYYATANWHTAMVGLLTYIMFVLIGLWMF